MGDFALNSVPESADDVRDFREMRDVLSVNPDVEVYPHAGISSPFRRQKYVLERPLSVSKPVVMLLKTMKRQRDASRRSD